MKKYTFIFLLCMLPILLWAQNYQLYTSVSVNDEITALNLFESNKLVIMGGERGSIITCNLQNQEIKQIPAHNGRISDINISSDKKWLATASHDGTVKIWNMPALTLYKSFKNVNLELPSNSLGGSTPVGNEVTFCVFSADNKTIYWGGYNGKIAKVNLNSDAPQLIYTDTLGGITSGVLSNDKKQLIFGTTQYIHFLNLTNNTITKSLTKSNEEGDFVCEVATNPANANELAYWAYNGTINIWDINNKRLTFSVNASPINGTSNIEYSNDGKYLLSGNSENNLSLWQNGNRQLIQTLVGHTQNTGCFSFSADAKFIYSAGKDRNLRIWKMSESALPPRPVDSVSIKTIIVKNPDITLLLRDHQEIDGDTVSVSFNGNWIVNKLALKEAAQKVNLHFENKHNYITLFAHNEGTQPPNTAEIIIKAGNEVINRTILKSTLRTNSAIHIIYQPD